MRRRLVVATTALYGFGTPRYRMGCCAVDSGFGTMHAVDGAAASSLSPSTPSSLARSGVNVSSTNGSCTAN